MNTKSEKKLRVFRQGDILIIGVEEISKYAKKMPRAERHIIAEGEATGHHHAIPEVAGLSLYTGSKERWRGEETIWLQVKEVPARMEHPEHGTIEIPLGNYEIRRQREYHPIQSRYVLD